MIKPKRVKQSNKIKIGNKQHTLKIGDIVRIKKDFKCEDHCTLVEGMLKERGVVAKITITYGKDSYGLENVGYCWPECVLELLYEHHDT